MPFKGGYVLIRLYYIIQTQIRPMKPFKNNGVLKSNMYNPELRLSVFAEPSARKSYQRLFEIAKLNFQSIDTPQHIANLLYKG